MRVRKKKNLVPRLDAAGERLVDLSDGAPRDCRGIFGNGGDTYIEIGCGKGRFICEQAKAHPDCNFIGVEKVPDVLVLALERAQRENIPNVRFIRDDAAVLGGVFGEGAFTKLYLNFSDPWPKGRHAKRRLTYKTFLALYARLLDGEGALEFKTDNRPLFDWSVDSLRFFGAALDDVCFDLHARGDEGNIMTEYEQRFSELGKPICFLSARLKPR